MQEGKTIRFPRCVTHTVKTWPSAIYNGLLQIPAKSRDIPPFQGTKHQAEQWTHWKLKIIFVFSLLCQWEAIWEKCLAEKYIWSGEPAIWPLWSRFSIIKMMEWAILVLKEVQVLPLRFQTPPYTEVGQKMPDIIILGQAPRYTFYSILTLILYCEQPHDMGHIQHENYIIPSF